MTNNATASSPFTSADLPRLGLTRRDLYRKIEAGKVRRLTTGAYVDASTPDSAELRAAALGLVLPAHQVIVDRTAAHIHGVDALTYAELDIDVPIETCSTRPHTHTRRTGVRGRNRRLRPDDIQTVAGIRVTTPLRTACDLGRLLRRREAYAAMCALARAHGLGVEQFAAKVPSFKGQRGVVQLRELIPLVSPRFESNREAWTFLAINDAGLPLPTPQYDVVVDDGVWFRLDLAYPHARVCVEYDGREFHDRTEDQRRNDRDRRAWLRDHGWTVVVIRLGDFTGERLDRWLRDLRDALTPTYSNRRWRF